MSVATILLKTGAVPSAAPTDPIYAPSNTAPKKAAIVKSMRITNTGSTTATISAWFQKGGGTFSGDGPTSGTARRLLPSGGLSLPAGATVVEDNELTLDSGDALYLRAHAGTAEFVFSGVERDVS